MYEKYKIPIKSSDSPFTGQHSFIYSKTPGPPHPSSKTIIPYDPVSLLLSPIVTPSWNVRSKTFYDGCRDTPSTTMWMKYGLLRVQTSLHN